MDKTEQRKTLLYIYENLYRRYGPQHWWPAEEPLEVIVGAILTQSAAWVNVEKAIANLKKAEVLSTQGLRRIPHEKLANIIYPCGYYNAKAAKLKAFAEWFSEKYNANLAEMFSQNAANLRQELLGVIGIGDETADSVLLYAGNQPSFVIDAYTCRIIDRIGLKPEETKYRNYQDLFMKNLPLDREMFNEYHALLVAHAKEVCRKKPLCEKCCLQDTCEVARKTVKQLSING